MLLYVYICIKIDMYNLYCIFFDLISLLYIYKFDYVCNDIVDIFYENVLKLLIYYNSI